LRVIDRPGVDIKKQQRPAKIHVINRLI